jgi:hypothetical protein
MNLTRYFTALIPAVILMACGQAATPAKITYPSENFAASSDTQAKTAVKLWKFQGAPTGLTVIGADSSDKTYHVLSITGEDANTFKIAQGFKNAAGELLASVSVLVHNDGTYSVSKTGNPNDPAFCPNCMGSDFTAANPSASDIVQPSFSGSINPAPVIVTPADPSDVALVSAACAKALKHLAKAAMNVAQQCGANPTGPGSFFGDACQTATLAYELTYSYEVVAACGPIIGGGPGL